MTRWVPVPWWGVYLRAAIARPSMLTEATVRPHNFSAGPSILPREVIEKAADALRDFAGTGLSLIEVSHRGKEFEAAMANARALVKELLGVPDGYDVLFLQGGASLGFHMVPMNLMREGGKAVQSVIALATEDALAKAQAVAKSAKVELGAVNYVTVTEEPVAQVLREQRQIGNNLVDYAERELHVLVTVGVAIN